MKAGIVIGKMKAHRRVAELPSGALVEVRLEGTNERIIALDPLECAESERVLLSQGASAGRYIAHGRNVVDALIIASLKQTDSAENDPDRPRTRDRTLKLV